MVATISVPNKNPFILGESQPPSPSSLSEEVTANDVVAGGHVAHAKE